MRRAMILTLTLAAVVALASPAMALNPATELYVPAAATASGAGGSQWITDLYIFNPGTQSVSVDIYFLPRSSDNSGATPESFTLGAMETLVLPNVIVNTFGLSSGAGAFRIVATGEVIANTRVYNQATDGTFGQGLEGVPASAAVTPSSPTDIVGLASSTAFRSNILAVNTSSGSTSVTFTLMAPNGSQLATRTYSLQPYSAFYASVTDLGAGSFDDGTLHVEVSSGSAIVVASKVDNGPAGDPTTLEAWWAGGAAGGGDGTYQFAVYDSIGPAGGGNIPIAGGQVPGVNGVYFNWDKDENSDQVPDCTLIFDFSASFGTPVPVDNFSSGVSYDLNYPASGGFAGGDMTWTVTFSMAGGGFSGTVGAVGANFSGDDAGCNGTFPALALHGGVQ